MKIIIATDGSIYGDAAVQIVGKSFTNADVKIISVYESPAVAISVSGGIPTGYNPILETEFKELAASAVVRAEKCLKEKFPKAAREITTEVLSGSPSAAITEEAKNWEADLIVTGSHGYGFWKRALIGSVSNEILHHAPCSVLIVRRNETDKSECEV